MHKYAQMYENPFLYSPVQICVSFKMVLKLVQQIL